MSEVKHVVFVIYDNPSDYPGRIVVRRNLILPGRVQVEPVPECIVDDLAAARLCIPEHYVKLRRTPHDDPCIVESWL